MFTSSRSIEFLDPDDSQLSLEDLESLPGDVPVGQAPLLNVQLKRMGSSGPLIVFETTTYSTFVFVFRDLSSRR